MVGKPSSMAFKAIKRSSAPELVVEQIVRSIESGTLQSGSRLPSQKELSARFRISRASVREATKALDAMGYLDIIQGKGTFIRNDIASRSLSTGLLQDALQAVSFFDLMQAREILECNAAQMAAEMADKGQIDAIEAAVERMAACRGEQRPFLKADLDFHVAIAEAANNPVIGEMMKLIVARIHTHDMLFLITSTGTYADALVTGRRILAHIAAGEGPNAFDSMRTHLKLVTDVFKAMIAEGRIDRTTPIGR